MVKRAGTGKRTTAKASTARGRTAPKGRTAATGRGAKAPAKRAAPAKRSPSMRRAPATKALSPKEVVRTVEQLWSQNTLDQLDRYFAPGFRSDSGIPGMPPTLETAKMAHQMTMQAFPDRKVRILDLLQDGNRVVVRCRMTGTNTGGVPWLGAPANDAKLDIEWISIYDVRGGRVTRHHGLNDGLGLLTQLGLWSMPAMGGPSEREDGQSQSESPLQA